MDIAGIVSGQKALLVWIEDIFHHFWYACQHTSTREEFMGVWRGALHHMRLWRINGTKSPFHVVLNRRWLKDIEKLLTFRTTSKLESFQNHVLMYAGKRFGFTYGADEVRTLLAALDYNLHNHRPVHVNSKGQVSKSLSVTL
ncbi:unnamed protein product [Knipowitschia caucasica]